MGIKHSNFSWLLMILAVNENMHKSLDEFEFGQDLKTDYERLNKYGVHTKHDLLRVPRLTNRSLS